MAPAAIKTEEINVVGVRGSQSAVGGGRNGDARRGARSPHVWRAVRDAYSVNSGGRRVERGIVRWKPAARRATRYEQGGSGWVRAAHCARREMNRGRGGDRGGVRRKRAARGARRVMSEEDSGAVRGVAHCARREMDIQKGGERRRRAAEARGALRATRNVQGARRCAAEARGAS